MTMKIMCHSENSMTSWPRLGAMTGMTMNTMKTSDMTSAIGRPPNTSRMMDTAMTRVEAAPMPWTKRRASSVVEARRESRAESRDYIDGEPEEQRLAPPEAVGERAEDELRERRSRRYRR